jgi:Na+/proline symporter
VEAWRAVSPEKLRLFGSGEFSRWELLELWALTIGGSVVAQEVVSRVLGAKSHAVARNAALLGGGLYLAVGLIPAFLGLIGPHLLPGLADAEQFLPRLAEKFLPTFVYVLFIGALVSAILSTVDSTLLAASSLVAHNVVVSFLPGLSERQKLRAARLGVVVFGLVAFGLALGAESVFELVQQANGVGSAGILVLLVFGLFSRLGGRRAATATLAAGLASWAWGTYAAGWTCTYLISIACSVGTYLGVACWESRFSRFRSAIANPAARPQG